MLEILTNNYLLIINILIPFAIGLFLFFTHKEYSLKEFAIQCSITTVILIIMFFVGYGVSNVYTKSYKTTNIQKFVYEESWTERVTYSESYRCGSGGKSTCYRTKTRYDHHPDYYYLKSDFGTQSISSSDYSKASREFGEIKTSNSHFDQSSYGDGKTFESIPNRKIPHADYESKVNYIYASKTNIIKSAEYKDLEKQYKSELQKYPELIKDKSQYGNYNFNRVINKHLINEKIANKLQLELEQLSINFPGNPIIYLTSSPSRDFAYVVKGFYADSNFNDAMFVLGTDGTKILWAEPVSISKSAEFKVYSTNLTDNFEDLISKYSEVLKTYWKKPNLEEYKYLANDIDLPLWYELVIVLLNIVCSTIAFRYMLKNEL